MGRYARREAGLAELLSGQEGWIQLREMRLLDAVGAFSGSTSATARIGAARAHLALADLFETVDEQYLETETDYLDTLGPGATPPQRARRGLAWLRRGDLERAGMEFAQPAPPGWEFFWALGRAGAAALGGDPGGARARMEAAPTAPDETARSLAQIACRLWAMECGGPLEGPQGPALEALRRGDVTQGVAALQGIDFTTDGSAPGPELFIYPLLQRAFARLALSALGDTRSAAGALLAGRARDHLGDHVGAADLYARVGREGEPGGDAAWVFSPCQDPTEAIALACAQEGAALFRAGRKEDAVAAWRRLRDRGDPGPLATATLAALQLELGSTEPLDDPLAAAQAALAAVGEAPSGFSGEQGSLLAALYPVRAAAVARMVARVLDLKGSPGHASEVMERAHRKSRGYRADFINPPSFLADLARTRKRVGAYPTAVAVLFELATDYPSVRIAYESLKRLYASRSGGGAPPR